MSERLCVCGHPQGRHLLARRDCKSCPTCTTFEPAPRPSAELDVVLDVMALLGEVKADAGREAELTARLADVERQLAARPSEADWTTLKSERARLAAEVDRLTAENLELVDVMPCGWCDGVGVAPGERFGRDADGAPNVDEDRPCPEGCEIPAWLRAERNDAADDARQLAEARQEIERLGAVLEQAEQYARDLQDEGVVPDRTVVVLFAYDAWQCLGGSVNCSRRYFADDPDHGCGPLTPVTVTVTRRPA